MKIRLQKDRREEKLHIRPTNNKKGRLRQSTGKFSFYFEGLF